MAEKRENSVLFSLRELRQIEDDRVTQEEADTRQREEDARRAREEAERRAREEAERARREVEDAERRRVDEEQRRIREDQLRLDEAERRARVDAQMKLDEQRLRMEMEAQTAVAAQHKKPTGLIVAASLLVVLVIGLGIFLYQKNQEAQAAEAARVQLQMEIDDQLKKMAAIQADSARLLADYQAAATVEERKQLEAKIAANKQAQDQANAKLKELKDRGRVTGSNKPKPSKTEGIKKPNCDPNDPLCGA